MRFRLLGAEPKLQPLLPLATGIILYAACHLTHANPYLAAFSAGAVLAHVSPEAKASFEPLGEALAELAKFAALLVFGALLTPQLFGDLSLGGYAAVVLAIFLIRPASLLLSLLGTGISRREKLVAAWFGPKGFASVVYGLLVLQSGIPQAEQAFTLIAVCIAFSIIAHSSTDVPIARAFDVEDLAGIPDGSDDTDAPTAHVTTSTLGNRRTVNDWHSWAAIVVFVGAYALIISEKIHRVAVALGGAGLMLAIGATDDVSAFYSEDSGIDWNVIFLLMGMMMIVGVLKKTGMFEYLAIWAVKRARAQPFRVMAMLVVITAVASALLDNVTTVLLIAPVTLLVCERLALPAAPFLIAEVMASNIGGTATLVGDPPNIIIASRAGLTFNDFLVHLAPLSAVLVVVLVAAVPGDVPQDLRLRRGPRRRDHGPGGARGHQGPAAAGPGPGRAGPGGGGLRPAPGAALRAQHRRAARRRAARRRLHGRDRATSWPRSSGPRWPSSPGLFIMIGGLIDTGVIGEISKALADAIGDNELGGSMTLLGASAVLSGIVDNIPYVATMAPITSDLVHNMGGASDHVMWWALALGADLGGNATAIGASANVVVLGIAERNRQPITFWQFTKYGLIVTAVTVAISLGYVWLRYFALG